MIKHLLWLLFFIPLTVFADNKGATVITLGIEDINYFPHYDARFDEKRGYIFELLAMFEKQANVKFQIVALPTKRLNRRFFKDRDLDLIYPFNPGWVSPETDKTSLMFSAPIVQILGGTMVKTENRDMELSEFSVLAVPRGFTPIEWYKLRDQYEFQILEVANAWDALQMVMLGRADGADIEFNVARALLNKYKKSDALDLGQKLPFSSIHFFMATYNQHFLLTKFDTFMRDNHQAIEALKQKYQLQEQMPSGLN